MNAFHSAHILRTIAFLSLKVSLGMASASETEVLILCFEALESEQLKREAKQLATLQFVKPKTPVRLRIPRLRMNPYIIATDAQGLIDCPAMLLIECDSHDRMLESSVISRN